MKEAEIKTKKINSTDMCIAEDLDLVAAIDAGCIIGRYIIKKSNGFYNVYKIVENETI